MHEFCQTCHSISTLWGVNARETVFRLDPIWPTSKHKSVSTTGEKAEFKTLEQRFYLGSNFKEFSIEKFRRLAGDRFNHFPSRLHHLFLFWSHSFLFQLLPSIMKRRHSPREVFPNPRDPLSAPTNPEARAQSHRPSRRLF